MYTLIAENQYGQQIELTHSNNYSVKSVLGFDPPDGIINLTRNAGQDGSEYNSSYMDNRTITITLAINYPAEKNRIDLYKFFKIKQAVKLYFRNGSRNVWINGYTQSFQVAFFDQKETAQITVICPRPYLNDVEPVIEELTNIISLFEFPFEIEEDYPVEMSRIEIGVEKSVFNAGDVSTGMIVKIRILGSVTNPIIYNPITNEFIKILDELSEGDYIEICTIPGRKSIKKISSGMPSNLIGKLAAGSTWMQLQPGDNVFSISADMGEVYLLTEFEMVYLYEGV